MTRRGVLGSLAAAFTLDLERLLWIPGAKLISIPKRIGNSNRVDHLALAGGYRYAAFYGDLPEWESSDQ